MIQINARTRRWGNSVGVVIPSELIQREGITEGQEVIMTIVSKKKTKVKDIFGKLKFKRSTQEILDEVDRDLEPETFS